MNLRKKENNTEIPKHVAIIMDGNGRWAKKKGFERIYGHSNGKNSVREVVEACVELKIKYLTLYTFSTENWNRPKTEVNFLMNLFFKSMKEEAENLIKNGVKLIFIGDFSILPTRLLKKMEDIKNKTSNGENITLCLAINYGSKREIIEATKQICKRVKQNEIDENEIDEDLFSSYLYTKDIPDVDLMIRTGEEKRISNFMLWQVAYSELYFSDIFWPDFKKQDFYEAIYNYQKRDRRFGKVFN